MLRRGRQNGRRRSDWDGGTCFGTSTPPKILLKILNFLKLYQIIYLVITQYENVSNYVRSKV